MRKHSTPSPGAVIRGVAFLLCMCKAVVAQEQSGAELREVEWQRITREIVRACPLPSPPNVNELLDVERRLSFALMRDTKSATQWNSLACVRARLFALDAIGREGPAMPTGGSWAEGAIGAVLEGWKRAPESAPLELLGSLAFDEYPERLSRQMADVLVQAAAGGIARRNALRACSDLLRRRGDPPASLECSKTALGLGIDSTFHLLNQARAHYARADTAQGQDLFLAAVAAAADTIGRADARWHFAWFLEPHELETWDGELPNRVEWVGDLLARRDLRDGTPHGARLAAHFERLEVADSLFRVRRPLRDLRRFDLAATPENRIGSDWITKWPDQDPAGIPAKAYRFFRRVHYQYDDRAAVWMRWGPPSERHISRASAHVEPKNAKCSAADEPDDDKFGVDYCLPAGTHLNSREGWLYRLAGQSILVNLEGESFDRSGEATRLVAGVLGFYLCGLETTRCNLTNRSSTRGLPALSPEAIAGLRTTDQALIDFATTHDGNAERVDRALTTVAGGGRVWPEGGSEQLALLIAYAIRVADVAEAVPAQGIAVVGVIARQWDPQHGTVADIDDSVRISLNPPTPGRAHATGLMVLPSSGTVRSWSLVTSVGAGVRGNAWHDGLERIVMEGISASDVILGQSSQGVSWRSPSGTMVPLGPLGAFDRGEPIGLFMQLRADRELTVNLRIAIEPVGEGPPRGGLRIGATSQLGAGMSELTRELDVRQLAPGAYRLRVELTSGDSGIVIARTHPLLLR